MSSVLFSVIIPTCHRNDDLRKCLEKLAPEQQTGVQCRGFNDRSANSGEEDLATYEVIVSDDGKSATSESLVLNEFPWAHWIQGPQKGPAANRNNGASRARGEWLVFTDDDCQPDTAWLHSFARAISANLLVLEGKTICRDETIGPFEMTPVNETGGHLWSCNMAIRQDLFNQIGGFDAGYPFPHLEDVDFRMKLESRRIGFSFVPNAIVEHPKRPLGSILKEINAHESYFFMSRKWGITLRQTGLSFVDFFRYRYNKIKSATTLLEAFQYSLRVSVTGITVLLKSPLWLWRYRNLHSSGETGKQ